MPRSSPNPEPATDRWDFRTGQLPFAGTEFETLKQETLADIEQGRSEPQQIASTAYQRHLSPYPKGDVRYVSTPEEDLAEVKAALKR